MQTITDGKDFKAKIVNSKRFNALNDLAGSISNDSLAIDGSMLQNIFEQTRNAMLEIFPNNNGTFDEFTLKFAENFSFIFVEKVVPTLFDPIKKSLETVAQQASVSSNQTQA